MRGRGGKRGRGRPCEALFHTRSELVNKKIFIKKPVYLRDKDDDIRGSRSSTPGVLAPADGEENAFSRSRSSSVTRSSLGNSARKKKTKKLKAGTSASADTTQDYYYGSDFENLSDIDEREVGDGNESEDSDSEPRSVYDADELLSESELSLPSSAGAGLQDFVPVSRPPTPVPVWLQDREIPDLALPPSSEDLVIPRKHILQTCAVYEVLRHFRTQIFLSPFTLEDFSAALLAEEQSKLLSEVHHQLLRLILREDEKQQVQFGPQDHKDSINSVLYLCDLVSWPETLRVYLHARVGGGGGEDIQEAIRILDNNEYPFVPFEERLKVLQVLVDMLLVTPIIRNEFQREGPINYDDHCRSCHRLGDLLCCETCPATYHLDCVNPPLKEVPDHDWQCEICRKHQVKGVTDCVSDMERNGAMSRQEVLGYDRHGRRYWFLCRRLFIESPDSPESVVYYSTPAQYAELVSRMDRADLEDALCMSLQELHYDIQRQMALTEEMTEQRLRAGAISYLQQNTDRIKGAEAQRRHHDVTPSGDADTAADDADDQQPAASKHKQTGVVTRTKSGVLAPKTAAKTSDDSDEEDVKPSGVFRLGDETDRTYQRYENQYTSNPLALNRFQLAEDKDKRRHMSHKFSLTQASEFEWKGAETGTRQQLKQTLKQTLQELVSRLPQALMHPSWPQLRRAWNSAVAGSSRPQDFARALTVISALIKPRLLCTVWPDSLSHVDVQRITVSEREERKKAEKREKRERDEEELVALRIPFVKYNLSKVKHQVWKQRGEEYRIHGQTGWLWLSSTRRYRPAPAGQRGHAAGPHREENEEKPEDGGDREDRMDDSEDKADVKEEKMDVDKDVAVKEEPDETKPPAQPRFAGLSTEEPVRLVLVKPVVKRNYVRGRWSMLVLPTWELRQLARKRGHKPVDGFNYAAKNNSQVWPYPCPRASLRTGWLYRTCRVRSLHAAGLQLRILWACVRWDDIDSRPQQVGPGEFQITTDTGMVRSLVLRHRDEGRFRERTVYYRRRVTILFDNPVIVEKEYTSSARSGLRKRRRVIESSENPSSDVTEEWVPEEALEIFEIKYYHEKVERLRQERQQALLQRRASPAAKLKPAAAAAGATQLKARLDEAVRQSRTLGKGTKFMVKPSNASTAGAVSPGTPQRTYGAMRKIITKDGKIIAIQSAPSGGVAPAGTVTVGTGSPRATQPTLAPAPSPAVAAAAAAANTAQSPAAKPNQIQIIKLPDGKLQVKGLKPGQQLVQLPSGQLQLVSGGTAKSLQAVSKQTPVASTPPPAKAAAPAAAPPLQEASPPTGQLRVVQKMVTQVVDLAGLTKQQVVGWQQKINEGKAKLALVNGRRVILHNVLVNQSVSAAAEPAPAAAAATTPVKSEQHESADEDDPAPQPPQPPPSTDVKRESDEQPPVAAAADADAAAAAADAAPAAADVKTELAPGRRITATANIVQTVAGPRVVIQGVPTQGLSQSQLHNLQQQVKAELAKGPMLTGLRDIHLTVPADVPEPATAPAPAAPPAAAAPAAAQSLLTTQRQTTLLSPRRVSEPGAAAAGAPDEPPSAPLQQDFTVTQEYIQQSINNALNSDNLKPEIAEKLLQLRKKPSAGGDGGPATPRPAAAAPRPPGAQPPKKRAKTDRPRVPSGGRTKPRSEKKSLRPSARVQQLSRRKEQLKKEILRKRLQMENQLQLEISKQVAAYRRAVTEHRAPKAAAAGRQRRDSSPPRAPPGRKSEESRKRKSSASRGSPAGGRPPAKKPRKAAKEGRDSRDAKKLHCVCRQPYDASKFYVGCDMCSNWYHGSCVGISQRNSKKVKAFICQQCQSAKENRELFCFCRTEYDESQFYIGCDKCEDWFHGRCVGILPSEGDDIDDYVCPRCDPSSRINRPNFQPLNDANYAELRRVFKQIKNNKNAWPFIEPVDPDEVPNYYKVIKEPMDLQTMENRLESRHYGRLCDFTGDMIVVLDNCKYFNPPGTRLATCGTNLEAFFRAELKKLRAKI
ncbi:LOW QUALITY PROTEIN: nucleosome-remodeling factor subunit NURF301-like [Pollicipes pollicipes]|uniref:LOW QUALITY PROTEIN: nucleosome-remodeling factor subunit NURF301-like n=1 Tax=Pollicipes pollicipes TaxID=41117 RepID=UPI0018849998|nr:LOW QUALITY PROTEIN: nucleosome-remodeling factor subunit NURF301-like [Pollicipes pollicipes]